MEHKKPEDIAEETDRDVSRLNALIAVQEARSYHSGYRVGLKDAFFFAFALVIAAITVFTYMEAKDR